MKDQIQNALKQVESEYGCRILFAVESGSRAWGFASPDSDYDIRAVYVKPLDWYLGLEERKADTLNAMLPGDLDIAAWDLRKALRHLLKSNASFMEWLGSPIVYSDDGLIARLNELKDACTNPVHVAFHYASMFSHAMKNRAEDGTMSVKKLCYALRASLCVRWELEHETMPPTAFGAVREGVSLSSSERDAIDALLAVKADAKEKDRIQPYTGRAPLLVDPTSEIKSFRWHRVLDPAQAVPALESIFKQYVTDLAS